MSHRLCDCLKFVKKMYETCAQGVVSLEHKCAFTSYPQDHRRHSPRLLIDLCLNVGKTAEANVRHRKDVPKQRNTHNWRSFFRRA